MARAAGRVQRPARASVWLDGRTRRGGTGRGGQPSGLDRDRITEATVRLLDEEGLPKFSMRRLAAELNVTAMSVYWYVDTKDDLLELALDHVHGELRLPARELNGHGTEETEGSPRPAHTDGTDGSAHAHRTARTDGTDGTDRYVSGTRRADDGRADDRPADNRPARDDWRGELRQLMAEYRALLVRHPWLSPLAGTFLNIGPHALAFSDAVHRVIARAGLPAEGRTGAISAVVQFVYGFGTTESHFAARSVAAGMTQDAYFRYAMSSVKTSPEVSGAARAGMEIMAARGGDTVEEMRERDFAFALDLLVAGIEAMAATPPDGSGPGAGTGPGARRGPHARTGHDPA